MICVDKALSAMGGSTSGQVVQGCIRKKVLERKPERKYGICFSSWVQVPALSSCSWLPVLMDCDLGVVR